MLQLTRARNRLTTPATLTLPEIAASGLTVSALGQDSGFLERDTGVPRGQKLQTVISRSSMSMSLQFSEIGSSASLLCPPRYITLSNQWFPNQQSRKLPKAPGKRLDAPVYMMRAEIPPGGFAGASPCPAFISLACLPPTSTPSSSVCSPLPCPLTCWSMSTSTSTSSVSLCTSCTPCSQIPPR